MLVHWAECAPSLICRTGESEPIGSNGMTYGLEEFCADLKQTLADEQDDDALEAVRTKLEQLLQNEAFVDAPQPKLLQAFVVTAPSMARTHCTRTPILASWFLRTSMTEAARRHRMIMGLRGRSTDKRSNIPT